MSGLIWQALGKGVADAGNMVGRYAIGQAEEEQREARAIERENRQLANKEAREERTRLADIEMHGRVTEAANLRGTDRAATTLSNDATALANNAQNIAGDSPAMNKEEFEEHISKLNATERTAIEGTGLISKAMTPNQQEMQRFQDMSEAASSLGASSSVRSDIASKRKDVLESIRMENLERKADALITYQNSQIEQGNRRLDISEKNSEANNRRISAAIERAGQPKPDAQSTPSARLNSINTAIGDIRSSLDSGTLTKEEELKVRADLKILEESRISLAKQVAGSGEGAPKKPSDKPSTGSGLPAGAVYIGTSGGKPVYQTPDGKKYIGK